MISAPNFDPNHFSGRKVLITGGTGFVGSAMVRQLARLGAIVSYTYRNPSHLVRLEETAQLTEGHRLDLLDAPALQALLEATQPEYLFHFAQPAPHHTRNSQDYLVEAQASAQLTLSLLDYAKEHQLTRLVHACSSTVYGHLGNQPFAEDAPLTPDSLRGLVKLQDRNLCLYYANNYQTPVVLGRIFRAYGPWDNPGKLINQALQHQALGKPLALVSDHIKRDYVYVDDLVEGFLRLAALPLPIGTEVNLGSGIMRSAQDIITGLSQHLSSPILTTSEAYPEVPMDKAHWQADTQRAKALLGWEPKTTLAEGLQKCVSWYQQTQNPA